MSKTYEARCLTALSVHTLCCPVCSATPEGQCRMGKTLTELYEEASGVMQGARAQ